MALPPLSELLALLPDNITGDISAEDVRTVTTELYNGIASGGGGGSGAGVNVGTILPWAAETIPSGFLLCDGAVLVRDDHPQLFAVLGTTYGVGDGATTFGIPDYRGYFLRGQDDGTGIDPDAGLRTDRGDGTGGDNVGSKQLDDTKTHTHDYTLTDGGIGSGGSQPLAMSNTSSTVQTGATGGNETRPKNIYVQWIVRDDIESTPLVVPVGDLAPTVPAPVQGALWFNSANGQLYVYYDDGTTQQWIAAGGAPASAV